MQASLRVRVRECYAWPGQCLCAMTPRFFAQQFVRSARETSPVTGCSYRPCPKPTRSWDKRQRGTATSDGGTRCERTPLYENTIATR